MTSYTLWQKIPLNTLQFVCERLSSKYYAMSTIKDVIDSQEFIELNLNNYLRNKNALKREKMNFQKNKIK